MLKYISRSKLTLAMLWAALLAAPLALVAACGSHALKPFGSYSEYAILPADARDAKDVKWAEYMKTHFQKRSTDRNCVINGTAQDDSQLQLTVDLNPKLPTDYDVSLGDHSVALSARTAESMLWLLYQFMSVAAAEDNRLMGSDLPPSVLSCRQDTAGTFAFEYRSIYTPSNANPDLSPILGAHHIDSDWGLWGHNLGKVFTAHQQKPVFSRR